MHIIKCECGSSMKKIELLPVEERADLADLADQLTALCVKCDGTARRHAMRRLRERVEERNPGLNIRAGA